MAVVNKAIAAAPRPLVVACLIPTLQFLFGAFYSFGLVLLALLLASSLVAFIGLTRRKFSRHLVIAALGALMVLNALLSHYAHYAFFSNVSLFEAHEWHSVSARMLLWPFATAATFFVLNLGALSYVFWSKKVKAFYQIAHTSV